VFDNLQLSSVAAKRHIGPTDVLYQQFCQCNAALSEFRLMRDMAVRGAVSEATDSCSPPPLRSAVANLPRAQVPALCLLYPALYTRFLLLLLVQIKPGTPGVFVSSHCEGPFVEIKENVINTAEDCVEFPCVWDISQII
jgi:hypothetical protein